MPIDRSDRAAVGSPGIRDRRANLPVRVAASGAVQGLRLVLVTKDGGAAGSDSTECSYTYTVKALDDSTVLAEAQLPQVPRYHYVEYWYAGEDRGGDLGETSRLALAAEYNGAITLLICFGEIAKDDAC